MLEALEMMYSHSSLGILNVPQRCCKVEFPGSEFEESGCHLGILDMNMLVKPCCSLVCLCEEGHEKVASWSFETYEPNHKVCMKLTTKMLHKEMDLLRFANAPRYGVDGPCLVVPPPF